MSRERGARGGGAASASRWSCARRTCSAAAAWRSSTTPATLDRYMAGAVDVSHDRPVLIDGSSRTPSSSTSTAWPTRPAPSSSAASWSTSRRPASTPATAPASCRRSWSPSGTSATIRDYTRRIARALKVVGLMNVQYAIKDDTVYVLEVNPRASRTVPYLSKATGVPLAKIAARVMAGRTLADLGLIDDLRRRRRVREEPGVPVRALPGRRHDPRARDEVDRRGDGRRRQLRRGVRARRSWRAGQRLPDDGLRVHQRQQRRQADRAADRARPRRSSASRIVATRGTAAFLRAHGLEVEVVYKVNEGRPNIADEIVNGKIDAGHQHAARPRVVLRRPGRPPRGDDGTACRASRR